MNITDYILSVATSKLKKQPEVRDGSYSMYDDGGVEIETGEFLYGLTRLLRPNRVLTTGVYSGISDLYIALALKSNEKGMSFPIEYDSFHLNRAKELWGLFGIDQYMSPTLGSSLEYKADGTYEMIFLDTEPQIRFQELVNFYPHLAEGGYIFIHDLPRGLCQGNVNTDHPEIKSWPFGDLPKEIKQWEKEKKLVRFHLPAPRGLVGWYKPTKEDFKI